MGRLMAAAEQVDLKPPVGGYMSGFAARVDPTTGIHDPIMARAVLLDDGATMFAIVSCDLIGFTPESVADMRRRIAKNSSVPPENVFICCTHTHSAPTSMKLRGVLGYIDEPWLAECQSNIVNLVARLPEKLEPASVAHSATTVTGIGYSRQDANHRIDEELTAISIESESGDAIATLLNYATHAVVMGPSNLLYSGDHPGAAARQIRRLRGGIGLYLQGACGDVNPIVERNEVGEIGTFDDCEMIGERLAQAAVEVLRDAPRVSEITIRTARKTVDVPLDPAPTLDELDAQQAAFAADLEQARAQDPPNRIAELIAVAYLDWAKELREKAIADSVPKTLPAEVYAAAIGDIRIVGLPFETFSDIGLGIKEGLKPLKGVFVGYANGLWGYCPTRWAKDQGGYGADYGSARWFSGLVTPIGYGAEELLVREGVALGRSI
jgi:neutral ceramidase